MHCILYVTHWYRVLKEAECYFSESDSYRLLCGCRVHIVSNCCLCT